MIGFFLELKSLSVKHSYVRVMKKTGGKMNEEEAGGVYVKIA
jgi:hypothetical protein